MIRALLDRAWPWSAKVDPTLYHETIDEICRLPKKSILVGAARVLSEPCDVPLKVRAALVTSILLKLAEKDNK